MTFDPDNNIAENQPILPQELTSWTDCDEWLKQATIAQNQLYKENAGRMYDIGRDYDCIELKILTNAFGTAVSNVKNLAVRMNHWYSRAQRHIACKLRKKMQQHAKSEEVYLNVIYLMCYSKDKSKMMIPVFYFKNFNGINQYIDLEGRIYNNWELFLNENTLAPSLCCYPFDGHYGQNQSEQIPNFDDTVSLKLKVYETPACGLAATAIRWSKTAFTYGSMLFMAASVATSGIKHLNRFQKLAAWTKTAESAIGKSKNFFQFANGISTLVFSTLSIKDKWSHDAEDIAAEVSLIVSTVLTLISNRATKEAVKSGIGDKNLKDATFEDLSPKVKHFLDLFSFCRCASSVISVAAVLVTMLYKVEWTPHDYFNFASSIFTCYGVFTSPKGAKAMFEQIKSDYIMAQHTDHAIISAKKIDDIEDTITLTATTEEAATFAPKLCNDKMKSESNEKLSSTSSQENEINKSTTEASNVINEPNSATIEVKKNTDTVLEKASDKINKSSEDRNISSITSSTITLDTCIKSSDEKKSDFDFEKKTLEELDKIIECCPEPLRQPLKDKVKNDVIPFIKKQVEEKKEMAVKFAVDKGKEFWDKKIVSPFTNASYMNDSNATVPTANSNSTKNQSAENANTNLNVPKEPSNQTENTNTPSQNHSTPSNHIVKENNEINEEIQSISNKNTIKIETKKMNDRCNGQTWENCENKLPSSVVKKRQNIENEMMKNHKYIRSEKIINNNMSTVIARDELAKKIIKDENDLAGKAAYDYYQNNIIRAFKNTENEYVLNEQIVRMMYAVNDVRQLFCEVALTETTFDVKNGILLINGQLNIDGAAFAAIKSQNNSNAAVRLINKDKENNADEKNLSDGEILMKKTKRHNDSIKKLKNNKDETGLKDAKKEFLTDIKKFTTAQKNGIYRLVFEINIDEFECLIKDQIGTTLEDLLDFGPLNIDDYKRFMRQFNKYKNIEYQGKLILAAVKLSKALELANTEGLIACHQIIYNEASATAGFKEKQSNAVVQFLDDFNNDSPNSSIAEFIEEIKDILTLTYASLIRRINNNEITRFDNILLNENPKTVAAMAYASAYSIERDVNDENESCKLSFEEKLCLAIQAIICETQEENVQQNFVLSQDGRKWVLSN